MTSANEQPSPPSTGIGVVIFDHLDHPFFISFDLGASPDDSMGRVGIIDIDDVIGHLEDGAMVVGELTGHVGAQRASTMQIAADANVVHEQFDESVEVSMADCCRITRGQLADLLARDQPCQWVVITQ